MKLGLNNVKVMHGASMVLAVLAGGICVSPVDENVKSSSCSGLAGASLDENNNFSMTVINDEDANCHWKVDPQTYGANLVSLYTNVFGSEIAGISGTETYTFQLTGNDYFVKLNLVSPSGDILKSVDSKM